MLHWTDMIDFTLHRLGLGKREIIVYKTILEYSKIAPSHISRLTKIGRTTVYSVAKELLHKNLIIEDVSGKIVYYSPADQKKLESIVQDESKKVAEKGMLINELQEYIQSIPKSKTFSIPKIKMVSENDVLDYLYSATQTWDASLSGTDTTWWGFQDIPFVQVYEKWIDWYWTKVSKKTHLKMLTNSAPIEERMRSKKYTRRNLKFIENTELTATQWVVGNYVIMIITAQRPYYLIEINDSVLAHNMREMFKLLWEKTD
jgi:sugar-specific transcriptional regulator TrmB